MASIIAPLFKLSSLYGGAKALFAGSKSKIGDLIIDASLKEVITNSSSITEHPIETKSTISDHVFKNPLKIKIEGYITNSPLLVMGLIALPLQNNSVSSLINNAKSFLPFASGDKPSLQAYQTLNNAWNNRDLLTVVTKLDSFENMVIETMSFNTDEGTGDRLEFSVELMQVTFASVQTSFNNNFKSKAVSAIASGKRDIGISTKPTSFAKSAVSSVLGLFN